METARACTIPVTVLLGVREQDGKYNDRDRIMQIAYTKYLNSLCGGCGLPHSMVRGDENVGRIEWHDDAICHGCAARDSLAEDKNRTKYPGQLIYPVDTYAN